MPYDGSLDVVLDNSHGKAYIKWKIPHVETTDDSIISPPIYFLNIKWFFEIVTEKWTDKSSSFFIRAASSSLHYDATFEVGFGRYKSSFEFKPFIKEGVSKLWNICSYKEFLENNVYGDMTLLKCYATTSFTTVTDAACQTGLLYNTFISCGDFEDLFHDKKNSDVRIAVSGVEFKAHKLILQNRSPVFAAMFEHDMLEMREGIVKIDDCDPDVFEQFLHCIYTGKVEHLLPEDAARLYTVADKYGVKELKEKCAVFMVEYLSADNACDVLVTSDRHNDSDLKHTAMQFLVQNIEKVINTDKWKSLMVDYAVLSSRILFQVVQNGISSKAKNVSENS